MIELAEESLAVQSARMVSRAAMPTLPLLGDADGLPAGTLPLALPSVGVGAVPVRIEAALMLPLPSARLPPDTDGENATSTQ